jgi:hypothetical protein
MQSEQTRQWKREQRRLRREQKWRSLQAEPGGDVSDVPRREIFAALLDYVGPLLDALPEDADPKRTEEVLLLGALVWTVVVEEGGDADRAARKLIADMNAKVLFPPPAALVRWLAHRKVSRFGDDTRTMRGKDFEREFGED